MEIIDANRSERLEHAEKFAKISDLNESLATMVQDLERTEPVRDGLSRELAAAECEIEELQEVFQIENRQSAKLEGRLDTCKYETETKE